MVERVTERAGTSQHLLSTYYAPDVVLNNLLLITVRGHQ